MRNASITAAAFLAVLTASAAQAQTSAPSQTPPPAETPPPAQPSGEDWNAVSRSSTRVYLVDVNSLKVNGDLSLINLARMPLNPASPTDQSHVLVEMEFRCAAKQSRAIAETDHDEAGAIIDRLETGEAFGPYTPDTLDAYVAAVACEGARATPPTFPSVAAFIQAGRPAPQN